MQFRNIAWSVSALALAAALLAGCGGGEPAPPAVAQTPPAAPAAPTLPDNLPRADAGEPLTMSALDPLKSYQDVAQGKSLEARRDPFALLASESIFEREQTRERVVATLGGNSWPLYYEEAPPPPEEIERVEPQPRRRLAGVMLTDDGIGALIEMEDGRIYQVQPGARIPNSEWSVLSIDQDKAVLWRPGNRLPRQVVVTLEPGNRSGGGNAGGGNAGGGAAGGGAPNRPSSAGTSGGGTQGTAN